MAKPTLRWLLGVPVGLICLSLLLWALLPLFVSTDFVRNSIEERIAKIAGQSVSIGNMEDIRLFPRPSARLVNIIIRTPDPNAKEKADLIVATIDAIDLEMTISSLIGAEPNFTSIALVGPKIRVRQLAEQRLFEQLPVSNIVSAVRIAKEQRDEQRGVTSEQVTNGEITTPDIAYPEWLEMTGGNLTFSGGAINFEDLNGIPIAATQLTDVSGRISWPRLDGALALKAAFVLNGEMVDVSYRADRPIEALAGEITPIAVTATSALSTFSFVGNTGSAAGFYAMGDVKFSTPSMRRFLQWRGEQARPAFGLGAVTLSSSMQARGETMRLDQLDLDVEGNRGTGIVEIRTKSDAPTTLTGTLDFPQLDLWAFFSSFTALPLNTRSDMKINTTFMSQVQTDLRISASKAQFGNIALTDVAATAQTTNKIALFDIGDAGAFGGNLQLRLRLDKTSDKPRAELSIAGENIDLATAKAASNFTAVTPNGVANFSLDLNSPLDDWGSLFLQSDGQITLRMAKGTLPGIDPEILARVSQSAGFQSIEADDATAAAFESLVWSSPIKNGEIDVSDLTLNYGPRTVTLNGVVQLTGQRLALSAVNKATDESLGEPVRSYFIGGSMNGAYISPILRRDDNDG